MSATDGVVLQAYQGARRLRWATTSGVSPATAYHTTARPRQQNPNGTVRSTASVTRLRAWPTPAVCSASKTASLDRPSGGVPGDDVSGGAVGAGGDQRQVIPAALPVAVFAVGLTDQHDPDLLRAQGAVPQAATLGGPDLLIAGCNGRR
ncbi:MAG: hypothetical protein ACRDZ4_11225 [Egibacteraceae bacterium]